jgi:tetratricopeptide (TPR) repeat protein
MIRPYLKRFIFALAATCVSALVGCSRDEHERRSPTTVDALAHIVPEVSSDSVTIGESASQVEATKLPEPTLEAWQMRDAAAAALESGDLAEAGRTIRAAVRTSPNDPENRFLMAIILGEERRYYEAVRMLDRLSEESSDARLPALGQTAEWLVKQGDWAEAERRFRLVLHEVPDAVMALRQLSQLLIRQGRRLEAAEYLRELCRLGNIEEVELSTLLSLVVPFSSDALLEQLEPVNALGRARLLMCSGDAKSAAELLAAEASTKTADITGETALLGRIYAEQQDREKLLDWVSTQSVTPTSPSDAWFSVGVHHANQAKHVLAIESLCEAVLRNPTDTKAYQVLGESLRAIQASSESEKVTERAQLLARTQEIGDTLSQSSDRDPKLVLELARCLEDLHRPLESLAWQAVLLAYSESAITTSERQSRMAEMNQRRLKVIEAKEETASKEFVLCGIDMRRINEN